jgi:hypothetical protein
MTEHEHEQQADRVERELDDMQEQSERLDGDISEARSDWERKQADSSVPGAVDEREPEGPATEEGEPPGGSGDPPPEQQYPAKGD